MQGIAHRVNWIDQLAKLPESTGAEIDLRSWNQEIHLEHDPFKMGIHLTEFLKKWTEKTRGTLILNTKEDGLESRVLEELARFNITDFFFLDLPMPTIIRLAMREKCSKIALRVSEYEPPGSIEVFRGHVDWVWLDCFEGTPATTEIFEELKGFKVCLVSPELQKYPIEKIDEFRHLAPYLDAVCTKDLSRWGLKGTHCAI